MKIRHVRMDDWEILYVNEWKEENHSVPLSFGVRLIRATSIQNPKTQQTLDVRSYYVTPHPDYDSDIEADLCYTDSWDDLWEKMNDGRFDIMEVT